MNVFLISLSVEQAFSEMFIIQTSHSVRGWQENSRHWNQARAFIKAVHNVWAKYYTGSSVYFEQQGFYDNYHPDTLIEAKEKRINMRDLLVCCKLAMAGKLLICIKKASVCWCLIQTMKYTVMLRESIQSKSNVYENYLKYHEYLIF